ncbi:MAG: phospho-sugar mutase [Oscillospiraceae bacterium]|jgi:phosphoglucomutase
MSYREEAERWIENVSESGLRDELKGILDDEKALEEHFAVPMQFGTAGLRGVMGAGPAMMNVYTVRQATQGLADFIREKKPEGGLVAISYDSRINSRLFAEESASVLAANGVRASIYSELMPTPMLSFAVRDLKADAGIMITASHNPAKYNGYKVYGPDGCQMTIEDANSVLVHIRAHDIFDVRTMPYDRACEEGLVTYIGEDLIDRYFECVEARSIHKNAIRENGIKLVYSPLNGTGNKPVRRMLREKGLTDITVVKSQELPDGNFPTCPYPNPEMMPALAEGLKVCAEVSPDLFVATDPDADRTGVVIKDGEGYRVLTGNETGVLLLDYICRAMKETGTMPEKPVAVRSIVSTSLADRIAADYGVEMRKVLTGFKFIGEQILMLEKAGEEDRFIFGFEESMGYLSGSYVRDKDAVLATMLICEAASWWKSQGMTLAEALDGIYEKYGWYRNRVVSISFEGADPSAMPNVMKSLRRETPAAIAGRKLEEYTDYLSGVENVLKTGEKKQTGLPSSDVLEYGLTGGAKVIIRPSGTEPKMKIYLTAKESSEEKSVELLDELEADSRELLKQ